MAHRNSCTNQLTGIHLSQAESSLSGHTSIYMVKHQICKVPYTGRLSWHPLAVDVPACISLTREVFVIQSVRDGGQYSQSGYAFRKTVSRHLRPFPSPPGHLRPSLSTVPGRSCSPPAIVIGRVIGHGRAGSGR